MRDDACRGDLVREVMQLKDRGLLDDPVCSRLVEAVEASVRLGKEVRAIMNGAKAVMGQQGFTESARAIFDYCRELIGATSGYVALLNETGQENEVLFLEAGGLPCDVDPELPMPIRGLRAEVYQSNRAVYHNDFMHSEWVAFMPPGHVILKNVLFAPLVLEGKTVGVIGLANKSGNFNDNDARMASGFGELAAIALQNSRNLDERVAAEREREAVIRELKQALSEVQRLSGLLPICCHCKKIRDDEGYWNQIENYIHERTGAEFSHSVCRDCAETYYPEMNIYDDQSAPRIMDKTGARRLSRLPGQPDARKR